MYVRVGKNNAFTSSRREGGLMPCDIYTVINPLRMRSRVTVVVLCVCLSVCLSVTTLVARELISTVQACYQRNQHDTSKVFNTWISLKTLCSKVMALYTLRSARPYMKYCSYSTRIRINDTETVTFDRPIYASYCWPLR